MFCESYLLLFVKLHKHLKAPACQSWSGLGVKHAESALEGADCPHFWVASTAYASLPGGKISLRREFSPAFLAVPAPLPPRWSGRCARENHRWIRWKEWRWASPYLLPFPSDPAPTLWDRKPAPRFFPPEKGLDAPPVFFQGEGQGGRRWAFTKGNVCTRILWMNIKQNKVIEKKLIWGAELAHSALSRKKEGLIVFSPLQLISLPPGTLRGGLEM